MERLKRSRSDPCYFNERVLCRSRYWRAQEEWAWALVDYRIVSVETGNMLGKGFLIGGIVPWFLWTRKNSLVGKSGVSSSFLTEKTNGHRISCYETPRWVFLHIIDAAIQT